jgi:UDP-hydrolysing UDP-N-acetyl-D-glucosamine 2-epimerase
LRRIGLVTVGRSDFGLYRPLIENILDERGLELLVFVSGSHVSTSGRLIANGEQFLGLPNLIKVPMLENSDRPLGIGISMGRGVAGFAKAFNRHRPDLLIVLGDRFEMHAAALAALPFNIPVAHIHGGELTIGAIDEALRHSITKLSHLHFPSTQEYGARIRQLGEESWRVKVVGALGLDSVSKIKLRGRRVLGRILKWEMPERFILTTFHSTTLEYKETSVQTRSLLDALEKLALPVLFTGPNADTGGRIIDRMIRQYIRKHPASCYRLSLGTQNYYSAMKLAAVMVGNSSSGIIEASSFALPVVNIGSRQLGRTRPENVIDSGYETNAILVAMRAALSDKSRKRAKRVRNPYYAGGASAKIVSTIRLVAINKALMFKYFKDLK